MEPDGNIQDNGELPVAYRDDAGNTDGMSERQRLEVRLDAEVHDALRVLAKAAGVSANQIAEGVLSWAISRGHAGVPRWTGDPLPIFVASDPAPAVWFGHEGDDDLNESGSVNFFLDFRPGSSWRTFPGPPLDDIPGARRIS